MLSDLINQTEIFWEKRLRSLHKQHSLTMATFAYFLQIPSKFSCACRQSYLLTLMHCLCIAGSPVLCQQWQEQGDPNVSVLPITLSLLCWIPDMYLGIMYVVVYDNLSICHKVGYDIILGLSVKQWLNSQYQRWLANLPWGSSMIEVSCAFHIEKIHYLNGEIYISSWSLRSSENFLHPVRTLIFCKHLTCLVCYHWCLWFVPPAGSLRTAPEMRLRVSWQWAASLAMC